METLAYLHLALANESPTSSDYTALETTGESPNLFQRLKQPRLSVSTAIHLITVTVALGILGMARQASAAIEQGDRGSEVVALQQRLKKLGYFQANATGYFGGITKDAVRQYQKANGLTPDGVVGKDTSDSLEEQLSQSETPKTKFTKRVWRLGDRGEPVNMIQQRLAVAGFVGGEKGVFDEATQEAVRQFQQGKGLVVDGIVGKKTLAALPELKKSEPKPEPKKAPSWYEDESAPLDSFTR